ncbi:peptidoglycan-binding domain-containing protein [Mycobacterium kansasii]
MAWIGWTVGMSGSTIQAAKRKLRARYSYAKILDDTEYFGADLESVLKQYQPRRNAEGWSPRLRTDGVLDYSTQDSLGMIPRGQRVKPIMFTVEGHLSDMFAGPVADTAKQLEAEGKCRHQPIGYNSAALPFDNDSGVKELARLVGSTVMDNGVPFPAGTPWALGGFSQGGIVVSYFYFDYLAPGKRLNWRLKDLRGVLAYGNPCRQTDSIAPWAVSWISKTSTHGLDPYRRFGLPNYPAKPNNWMDVYREGDIFAENSSDKAGAIKAAVYQAVMGDFFSDPFSIAVQLAGVFKEPVAEIIGIITAIISGVTFLADNPSPHYSPYDISGGIDWLRGQLD